jgi:transmembrane sensor
MKSRSERGPDPCVQRAVRLWTRRHSGNWSETEEVELQHWLTADPQHRAAYERVASLWQSAEGLEGKISPRKTPLRFFAFRPVWAACAVVLFATVIVLLRSSFNWWNGVPVHWTTARGESREIALEDGTRVLLDADSDLVVRLGARVRRAALIRGEALFSVVHDVSRPFEVKIGRGRITDFGTRFDLEVLQDSIRVAVFDGRVGVATPHGEVLLTAGQGSGYDSKGALLPVSEVGDSAWLWEKGLRRFDDAPLADVVQRLARHHPVTFVFANPQLARLRLTGTFRMTDLSTFLRTLCTALPVEARWIAPQRVEFTDRPSAPHPSLQGGDTSTSRQ